MAIQPAATRPLSFEVVGNVSDGENRIPNDERPANFDKVEQPEEQAAPLLESWAFESEGYTLANPAAKADFDNVVLFPGHMFLAGGRYHDIRNIENYFDVSAEQVVPEGLFLIGTNYLIPVPLRERVLNGRAKAPAPAAQPDPLRKSNKES